MRGKIVQALSEVVAPSDDLALAGDHSPNRDFLGVVCTLGLDQSEFHEVFVGRGCKHGSEIRKNWAVYSIGL